MSHEYGYAYSAPRRKPDALCLKSHEGGTTAPARWPHGYRNDAWWAGVDGMSAPHAAVAVTASATTCTWFTLHARDMSCCMAEIAHVPG